MKTLFIALLVIASQNISFSQWVEQTTPSPSFPLFAFSFPSVNTGFAVGYGNRMIKTTNSGNNWFNISIFSNTANDLQAVWFLDNNTGWMCSTNDTLYKTTNSGASWDIRIKLISQGQKIFFIDNTTGWILAQPRFYKTTDAGASWNIINSQMGQYFTFINSNVGWMASYPGAGVSVIHKTTDGGVTWTAQYSTSNFRVIYSLEFADENTGWAAGYREHILKTTDGGVNWIQQRDMDNSAGVYSMDFINANTGWAIVEPGSSLYTINGGATWNQYFMPVGRGNVHFINSTTGWAINGKVFKTTSTGLTYRNLNLSSLLEGRYNESTNSLSSDSLTVYLRNSNPPYQNIDSAKSVPDSKGDGVLNFINAVNGVNYYLVVSHRSSIETWSSTSQSFVSNSMNYNFTSSSSQAFGNNLKLKGTRWTIYSGDVNQDGTVDLTDLGLIDNDAFNFVSGYVATDLNGDNLADITDLGIADDNSNNFVCVMRP